MDAVSCFLIEQTGEKSKNDSPVSIQAHQTPWVLPLAALNLGLTFLAFLFQCIQVLY